MLQKDLIHTSLPVVPRKKPISGAPSSLCTNGQLRLCMWPRLRSQAVHTAVGAGAASQHDTQVVLLFDAVPFMQAVNTCA